MTPSELSGSELREAVAVKVMGLAYIEWAANNAPSLAAEVARLRAALAIALECLEDTGGVRGPSPADCEDAAKLARAALEAK